MIFAATSFAEATVVKKNAKGAKELGLGWFALLTCSGVIVYGWLQGRKATPMSLMDAISGMSSVSPANAAAVIAVVMASVNIAFIVVPLLSIIPKREFASAEEQSRNLWLFGVFSGRA